jgi:transposase
MRSLQISNKEPSVCKLTRIGVDTSKNVFVLHGVNGAEQPVLRRKLRRRQVIEFFGKLEPTKIALEAFSLGG